MGKIHNYAFVVGTYNKESSTFTEFYRVCEPHDLAYAVLNVTLEILGSDLEIVQVKTNVDLEDFDEADDEN